MLVGVSRKLLGELRGRRVKGLVVARGDIEDRNVVVAVLCTLSSGLEPKHIAFAACMHLARLLGSVLSCFLMLLSQQLCRSLELSRHP